MSDRLTLISADPRFTETIQAQLTHSLGQPACLSSFQAYWDDSDPVTEGILILAVSSGDDAEDVIRLVQTVRLQEWPMTLFVLEAALAGGEKDLSCLDPYVAGRFCWPRDSTRLVNRIRKRWGREGPPPSGAGEELALREQICRRLLRQTPALLGFADHLMLSAAHDMAMLLTGETGTGKTYLARLLHECSPRKHQPFLVVPCGALPSNLVESAFFGHVRGAFTGADRPAIGKFAAAGEGTILLDEIDTLGLREQASLLRVLETGDFEPVGCNETQRCRARILVASNWCLEDAVARGRFRQDLYYRLNVMSFHVPPLRERVQDIITLTRSTVARLAWQFRRPLFRIHPELIARLTAMPWPGNIRQLQNILQQAVLKSSGAELLPKDLPELSVQQIEPVSPPAGYTIAAGESLLGTRQRLERALIQQALENSGYSRARAARLLGISRVTLYKKLKKYGLEAIPFSPQPTSPE